MSLSNNTLYIKVNMHCSKHILFILPCNVLLDGFSFLRKEVQQYRFEKVGMAVGVSKMIRHGAK